MKYSEAKLGRIFTLRLEHGDKLPDVIEKFALSKKILRGMCILVGGVDKGSQIVTGPKDGKAAVPDPILEKLNDVHEIAGVGTIFPDERSIPKLHMHAALGRKDKAVAGCIRPGVNTWLIGEVIILEIKDTKSIRKKDKTTGVSLLEIKE